MSKKIEIDLDRDEFSSLVRMAVNDLRSPPEQMRHILRLEIERRLDNKGNNKRNQEEKSTRKKNELPN